MNLFKKTQGQGTDLVILHGWAADHQTMQPLINFLSDRYRVTAIDLPGCGESQWNPNIKNMHDIADNLLPALPEHAIYVSWSFSGLVTTSIAARYPERVQRFIGFATSPRFVETDNWPGLPKPGFAAAVDIIKEIGLKQFMINFYDDEFAEYNEKPAAYFELLKLLPELATKNLDILQKGIHICDATDLRKEFQALTCPIDLILGGKDPSINLDVIEKITALNAYANIHVIPTAKHMSFLTHPAEFQQLLNQIM